jgi:hypothetical protein
VHAYEYTNSDAYANTDANRYPDEHADRYPDEHADTNANGYLYPDANRHFYADANRHTSTVRDPNRDGDPNEDPHGGGVLTKQHAALWDGHAVPVGEPHALGNAAYGNCNAYVSTLAGEHPDANASQYAAERTIDEWRQRSRGAACSADDCAGGAGRRAHGHADADGAATADDRAGGSSGAAAGLAEDGRGAVGGAACSPHGRGAPGRCGSAGPPPGAELTV